MRIDRKEAAELQQNGEHDSIRSSVHTSTTCEHLFIHVAMTLTHSILHGTRTHVQPSAHAYNRSKPFGTEENSFQISKAPQGNHDSKIPSKIEEKFGQKGEKLGKNAKSSESAMRREQRIQEIVKRRCSKTELHFSKPMPEPLCEEGTLGEPSHLSM